MSSAAPHRHDVEPLTTSTQWASLYDEVLSRSFPGPELEDRSSLLAALDQGSLHALGVSTPAGHVRAGVMYLVRGPVALILYLAAAPEFRGTGVGGALLEEAIAHARTVPGLQYVLAEVEHPDHHIASEAYGDPSARVRFYARHGMRVLAAPYFQPAIGPGAPRVPALLLTTLWVDDTAVEVRDEAGRPTAVSAPALRGFLTDYLADAEGTLPTDAAFARLLAAFDGAAIELVGPEAISTVPVGTLDAETSWSAPEDSVTLVADAILFDQDGTLISSIEATDHAWAAWAREFGPRAGFDPESVHVGHGQPALTSVRRHVPAELETEALDRINELELSEVAGIAPLPGVCRLLSALPPDRWTVVTSANRALSDVRLAAAGIDVPPTRVTIEDVERGKPAPDPFLLGAERLGFDPSECLVIEDAVAGIRAGIAAGCLTVAVGAAHRDAPGLADLSVPDIASLVVARRPDGRLAVSVR